MPPKTQSKKTKGKRRRAKTPKKVVSRGVTVTVNIGSTSKRHPRNYIKPNRAHQHNLIPATLIGQRSEPYDLGILGKLQERQNKLDNLVIRQYEDFRTAQEEQTEELKDAKEQAKILFSKKDELPELFEIPIQRTLSDSPENLFVNQAEETQTQTPRPFGAVQGVVVDDAENNRRYKTISQQIARRKEKAQKEGKIGSEEYVIEMNKLLLQRAKYKPPKRKIPEVVIRPVDEPDTDEEAEPVAL